MMRARDAIVGSEQVVAGPYGSPNLDEIARLDRLNAEYRGAILGAELIEPLAFVSTRTAPADLVAASAGFDQRGAINGNGNAKYRPLIDIVRPSADLADDLFQKQAVLVGGYAALRGDRQAEIVTQTTQLIPFFGTIASIEPDRARRILLVLNTALDLATPVVMRIKMALGCPRPHQFSDRIQPMINCPTHASLPSGHATQAHLLATVLTLLADPAADLPGDTQLFRMATRIAINRTVAGVHYPADSAAGAALGIQLGRWLHARATGGQIQPLRFHGTGWRLPTDEARDFHIGELIDMFAGDPALTNIGAMVDVAPAPLWAGMWQLAQQELADRWS